MERMPSVLIPFPGTDALVRVDAVGIHQRDVCVNRKMPVLI